MRVCIDLEARNASLGVATDDALLDSARAGGEDTIRLWVSRRAVVLGRSQSMAAEWDREAAERLGVAVVRRISGGGAVYHYPGNLNLSVTAADSPRFGTADEAFFRFLDCLALGLRDGLRAPVETGARALFLGGGKISGVAQARRGEAILLHATLLVRPDVVSMASVLKALRADYASHRVPSHPRPTTTLSEALGRSVGLPEAASAALEGLSRMFCPPWRRSGLTEDEEAAAAQLEATRHRSSEWIESA